jgi:large subunit ribosomal protein L25
MSNDSTLKAERREGTGKGAARKLRAEGKLPAVVYGGEGDTDHISLDAHDAEYLFRNISVDNTIVDLEIEGEKEPVQTLVREIQTHPWKATLLHVDFLRIQKGVAVEMDVPLNLVGTPEGVKNSGGVLEQIIHNLAIRCIPSKIPETIEVDVSGLDVNDVLHISDITVDEGIEIMIAPERTICSVAPPRAEAAEEGEEAAEPDLVGEAPADGAGGGDSGEEG